MALINPKWRKDAGNNAGDALARIGGCALTAAILKKLTDPAFTGKSDVNKTIGNIAAPTISLLGVAGDLFGGHPMLRAFSQGVYTFGIPKAIAVIAPSIGDYMGLKGIDATSMPAIMNGIRGIAPKAQPAVMNGAPAYPVVPEKTREAKPTTPAPEGATSNDAKALAEAMLINN